jgi:apolipoprotein N-acyltransferase
MCRFAVERRMRKQQVIAFIFTTLYVGIGTLWIFTSFGGDAIYFEWPLPIIITLPVTVISFAIRSGVSDYVIVVIIVQLIMFYLTYRFSLKLIRKFV